MRWPFILSLFFLLGAGLLTFFNILNGASTGTLLNRWYWLEADTNGIPGAHDRTRWTSYNSCGVQNGHNHDCTSSSAAYPASPAYNFDTTVNVPPGLKSRKGRDFYLTKVGWAFLLLALLFILLALLPTMLSFCLPKVTAVSWLSSISPLVALMFSILAASLLTAGYVRVRNSFRNDGRSASVNPTQIAFLWTTVALLILSSAFGSVDCCSALFDKRKHERYSDHYGGEESSHGTYGNDYVHEKNPAEEEPVKRGFFGRKKRLNNPGYDLDTEANPTGNVTGTNTAVAAPDTVDYARSAPSNDIPVSTGAPGSGMGSTGLGVGAASAAAGAALGVGANAVGKSAENKNYGTTDTTGVGYDSKDTAAAAKGYSSTTGATSDYTKSSKENYVSSTGGAPYPSESLDSTTKDISSAPYPKDTPLTNEGT